MRGIALTGSEAEWKARALAAESRLAEYREERDRHAAEALKLRRELNAATYAGATARLSAYADELFEKLNAVKRISRARARQITALKKATKKR